MSSRYIIYIYISKYNIVFLFGGGLHGITIFICYKPSMRFGEILKRGYPVTTRLSCQVLKKNAAVSLLLKKAPSHV